MVIVRFLWFGTIEHIGFFYEQKNHRFMIYLLEYIVSKKTLNVHLLFVGDSELRFEMEQLALKYNLQDYITFYGNTEDISGVMSAMDVFLFPSQFERLGIVKGYFKTLY